MKDKVLNIILVGLVTYLAIYFLFLKEDPYETQVENPNFSLEIILNGLEDNKEYLWVFSSIEPGVGIVTIDFRTGEINPEKLTKLKFKNQKLKINGRIEEPGLYSLRNIKGDEELVFMLDTCSQSIEARVKDLILNKHLMGYVKFNFSGSELNNDYMNFWNHPEVKVFNKTYLAYKKWSEERINKLYGISLDEYSKKLLTGNIKEIRQKLKVKKEEEAKYIIESERKRVEINELKQKAIFQFMDMNPNSRVGLEYLYCYVYMFGNNNSNYRNMNLYIPLIGKELQSSLTYQYMLHKHKQEDNLQIGKTAPDFTVVNQSGDCLKLSDLRGNIVLVEFWKSSCDYCIGEKSNLLDMYMKFQNKDFEILSVSFDANRKEWIKSIKKQGYPWLQFHDSLGYDNSQIIKEYAHAGIPYYFLIDKEGRIIAKGLRQSKIAKDKEHDLNAQLERIFGT